MAGRRRQRRTNGRRWVRAWQVLVVALIVLGMQVMNARSGNLTMPHPGDVIDESRQLWSDGTMLTALRESLQVFLSGFLLAAVTGVLVGIAFGAFTSLGRVFDPFVHAMNSTPGAAFIPLIIVWFGLYTEAKVVVVWSSAFFPILITSTSGIENSDADLGEMARSFGASRAALFWRVMVPGAVPAIISGLRIGAAVAIVGTVVSELYMAQSGLGGLLASAGNRFQMARYFAVVVVLMALGTIVTALLRLVESHFSRWRTSRREAAG